MGRILISESNRNPGVELALGLLWLLSLYRCQMFIPRADFVLCSDFRSSSPAQDNISLLLSLSVQLG